jgi:carbamate kinase
MKRKGKLAVVAVGGNSLILDQSKVSIPDQYFAVTITTRHIVDMIEEGWDIVLTHGNGPQIGFILRRSEIALKELHPVPMDYAGADIQGAVGYMFQTAFRNEFRRRGLVRKAITVVTEVLVDRDDPAFSNPTKPIGSHMDEERAKRLAEEWEWVVREDAGRGWRRVVPSPLPKEIIDLDAIKTMLREGFIVIACGGGGIPVVRDEKGNISGIEAVIDKDLSSSLLARKIDADVFVISTAVEKVALNFNKPNQIWLERVTLKEAKRYLSEGHFHTGSMEPKVRALIEFIESRGGSGLITNPPNLKRALLGETGTIFVPD